jgi:Endodeoxyribonuclease RusA.
MMITTLNKVQHIALDAFIAYLEGKHWKRVAYDDPRRIVFALDADDGYAPYLIALPASEEHSDYNVRIAEMVDRLAGVEGRTAQDVVESIVNPPFFVAELPISPGTNSSYETVNYITGDDRLIRRPGATKALKQFKKDAVLLLISQRSRQNWTIINDIVNKKRKKIHVFLKAMMIFHVKSVLMKDLDGLVKATQDAACKFMKINDNLIVDLHVIKTLTSDEEYCEMTVMLNDVEEYRRQCENEGKRKRRQKVAS